MGPGGHFITTVAACTGSLALTRSLPPADSLVVTAGVALGGFFIDVDHAVDYLVFERQRDLRPGAFIRYYLEGRLRRAVLVLHSYEVFALLGVLAWWLDALPLAGYLAGALLHLMLDLFFNGRQVPRAIIPFYSFAYRAAHRFDAAVLLGMAPARAPREFWVMFFTGARADGHAAHPVTPRLDDRRYSREPELA